MATAPKPRGARAKPIVGLGWVYDAVYSKQLLVKYGDGKYSADGLTDEGDEMRPVPTTAVQDYIASKLLKMQQRTHRSPAQAAPAAASGDGDKVDADATIARITGMQVTREGQEDFVRIHVVWADGTPGTVWLADFFAHEKVRAPDGSTHMRTIVTADVLVSALEKMGIVRRVGMDDGLTVPPYWHMLPKARDALVERDEEPTAGAAAGGAAGAAAGGAAGAAAGGAAGAAAGAAAGGAAAAAAAAGGAVGPAAAAAAVAAGGAGGPTPVPDDDEDTAIVVGRKRRVGASSSATPPPSKRITTDARSTALPRSESDDETASDAAKGVVAINDLEVALRGALRNFADEAAAHKALAAACVDVCAVPPAALPAVANTSVPPLLAAALRDIDNGRVGAALCQVVAALWVNKDNRDDVCDHGIMTLLEILREDGACDVRKAAVATLQGCGTAPAPRGKGSDAAAASRGSGSSDSSYGSDGSGSDSSSDGSDSSSYGSSDASSSDGSSDSDSSYGSDGSSDGSDGDSSDGSSDSGDSSSYGSASSSDGSDGDSSDGSSDSSDSSSDASDSSSYGSASSDGSDGDSDSSSDGSYGSSDASDSSSDGSDGDSSDGSGSDE